jgi:lysophospholipase L1-like esterase
MDESQSPYHWVGSWACSAQLTEADNMPPLPGLAQNTLRQIVQVSIGGQKLRFRFSNEAGKSKLSMSKIQIARAVTRSEILPSTIVTLSFDGQRHVTIEPGKIAVSDSVSFNLEPMARIAVSVHFIACPEEVTGHPGSRTTSFIAENDCVSSAFLPGSTETVHWYFLTGIDVWASKQHGAVVTLGDSITDGRGSTTDEQDRWPDQLSRRLRAHSETKHIAILNHGIGGNAVLEGGLGPTARQRFERDVLNQPGVRYVILLEGVNDIGTSEDLDSVSDRLISTFDEFIRRAHARGLLIYGAPILPFQGSQYSGARQEQARTKVNDWICKSGRFDAIIDFSKAVADPLRVDSLFPEYDSGDHLHLGPAGYQRMASCVDLSLFAR